MDGEDRDKEDMKNGAWSDHYMKDVTSRKHGRLGRKASSVQSLLHFGSESGMQRRDCRG